MAFLNEGKSLCDVMLVFSTEHIDIMIEFVDKFLYNNSERDFLFMYEEVSSDFL